MNVFVNHLGWEPQSFKSVVVQAPESANLSTFYLINTATRAKVFEAPLAACGPVAKWKDWYFWKGEFTAFRTPGRYAVVVPSNDGEPYRSDSFVVSEDLYRREILTDILHYFKSQRSSYVWDRADRDVGLWDSHERYDVHGGWWDASGDVSKYLSHLSYSHYMNPQQTPLVVWNLLAASETLRSMPQFFKDRLTDEIVYGADFLVRMQHTSGAFYTTLFDRWSKDPLQRHLCVFSTRKGFKDGRWPAAYRQGAGMAIAALARASRNGKPGDFSIDRYLQAARTGFECLEKRNLEFTSDGKENILDDYCALLAATELHAATGGELYEAAAARRVRSLVGRLTETGWWKADAEGERSFFHAADAGLPVTSLARFVEVFPEHELAAAAKSAIERAIDFEVRTTHEVQNPFAYPRHFVKTPGNPGRSQFFFPHDNESGYWWQGENARLGSIASAVFAAQRLGIRTDESTSRYAQACLDWVLGQNPFDIAMMHGKGHNNPQYEPGFYPAPGGICNGITSGYRDEDDIDFCTREQIGSYDAWRWGEQWLPHGAWYFLAVALKPTEALAAPRP